MDIGARSFERPLLTFRASVPSTASPAAVYGVLSDLRTHLSWASEQAPKGFGLLTVDAPAEPATVGTRFSSTGANGPKGKDTFHDRSVIVEAEPPSRFGFDTESRLERPRRPEWHVRFAHRYTIEPAAGGSVISYTCEVRPENYLPYWLKPWMRPGTRVMVQRMIRRHMRNLARVAETSGSPVRA